MDRMEPIELQFPGDRGFASTEPVKTTYGADVQIHESSAAMGPHIWLKVDGEAHVKEGVEIEEYSPATMFKGRMIPATRIVKADISAHMNLRQAEEIHARLGKMIEYAKETWDESAWYGEDDE